MPLLDMALTLLALLLLPAAVVLLLLCLPRLLPRRPPGQAGASRVAFLHPDLGIGGAERLVVDAAVALQAAGHDITIFTARHSAGHCFKETRDGQLRVEVYGSFLPRNILGRCWAVCAYLRMCWISFRVALFSVTAPYDVLIVDQVSICLPICRFARPRGILFYCHFPDYLLTSKETLLKAIYRAPLDLLEELTTGLADVICVNSHFTAGVFAGAFPLLRSRGVVPRVLYPALNLAEQDRRQGEAAAAGDGVLAELPPGDKLLLSLNRFERKKNVGLAIQAFAALPEAARQRVRLVIAGGYDAQLPENVEHAAELELLAKDLHVSDRVVQLRSISDLVKAKLLAQATCLLYTPDREHFGIVPVEAMYASVPVIAVNSGGPRESIVDGEEGTGFLREQDPAQWAEVIAKVLEDESLKERMGKAGRLRAGERFSLEAFGNELDGMVRDLAGASRAQAAARKDE